MVADGIESDERESDERKSTGGEKREGNYIFTVWRSGLEELRNLSKGDAAMGPPPS